MLRPGKLVTHSMGRRFNGWSGRRGSRGCALLLACIGAALTLGVAALFASSAPSFTRARSYATGTFPRSVAIGDLNGDGRPELAIGNYGFDEPGRTVSVFLNRGDGRFQAKLDYETGSRPGSVAIGDLNGDGKLDLATANGWDDSISVLINNGDGSLLAKHDYGTGPTPTSVAIVDLNGDGKRDLATANFDRNTVSVLANRGDGSFQAKLDYETGDGPSSVAIGDLNSDGKPDLATANSDVDTVSVLLNTPGLCTVQDVKRQTLPTAKRTIARANCRVGKIRRAYSKRVKNGRVISQKPRFGAVLPGSGKVSLVVSRGRRRS
jgi:FG-GAP-like repeat/FG-GAP repeat/PASTA domain